VTSAAVPVRLALISAGSPTNFPKVGLPPFITTNLPSLNVTKY
jgi:hypothetical protein